jgi:hypothetical protein
MLTGKYWLYPNWNVEDVSATEHVVAARRVILKLRDDDPLNHKAPFYQITERDLMRIQESTQARYSGEDAEQVMKAAKFMLGGGDPRLWAIQHLLWIRVAQGSFYFAEDGKHSCLARISCAGEYWKQQTKLEKGDMAKLVLFGENDVTELEVSVESLKAGTVFQRRPLDRSVD